MGQLHYYYRLLMGWGVTPSNLLVLERVRSDCECVILERLHHEIVTLGGCHLLDGLVVVSIEACKEDCVVLQRSDCERIVLTPQATKSNSSRAGHEG